MTTDGDDLRGREADNVREIFYDRAFVRVLLGDVDIVGLRPARRHALSQHGLRVSFAALDSAMIVADPDDLCGPIQVVVIRHNFRIELDCPCFARNMRASGFPDKDTTRALT